MRRRRHFSMIRDLHFADVLTIANGVCGVAAIFQAVRFVQLGAPERIYVAALLVALALAFDFLDGRVARSRHDASPLGRELDSLADVISFGVAPAVIAFAVGLDTVVDQAILIYFAACGVSRLARYNITAEDLSEPSGRVRYFEGTPIPTSVVPLGLLLIAYSQDAFLAVDIAGVRFHLVSLLFAVSGSLMISKTLHIPKP